MRAVEGISRDYLKAVREMNIRKNEMDRAQRIYDLKEAARAEEKLEIARKMKEMGLSLEQINTATGLSLETIEQM